ncbi:unnamed protein product [Vicia faba]|uniref:F-box domain-containing protein n=1 Tax=Vicia faba TaxID=3906 RepID=A0AAV1AS82_VICFA|nr:unnamed protein product [Vicia faba]
MNLSPVVLPNDLITEVLSILPVKSLVRFKCVCNHFKTLISDPTFVKLHLKRSTTSNMLFPFVKCHDLDISGRSCFYIWLDCTIVQYPIRRLLDNPSFTLFDGLNYFLNQKGCSYIVGSCNGLILLAGDFINFRCNIEYHRTIDYWLCVWNPATRKISKNFGHFREYGRTSGKQFFFAFGCDDLKDNYKVVAYSCNRYEFLSEVRVLSLGDDVWRNVESFPVVPLLPNYVYLSGTLNWLAIQNEDISVEKFVIVSLDLRTETYNQYLLPPCFDQESPREPIFGVLGGCISLSYCYKETDLVIWQMKQLGIQDSWTRFLKISYQNLEISNDLVRKYNFHLMPLFLSNDTLVLMNRQESQAILYNWRDNRVKRTNIIVGSGITDHVTSSFLNWEFVKGYVESLVPVF